MGCFFSEKGHPLSESLTTLQRAGIPLVSVSNGLPIGKLISLRSFFSTSALKPGDFGNVENRIRAIYKGMGGLGGGATSLLCAAYLPATTQRQKLLNDALEHQEGEILSIMRWERNEENRSLFRSALANNNDQECFEAVFALCDLGISEEDRPYLLSALKSQSDNDRRVAIITAMFKGAILPDLIANGQIEEILEDLEILDPLGELFDSEDPSSLIELCQSGDLSWQKRVCFYYILGLLAEKLSSTEYLESLIELFNEEDDNDASIMLMYAIGQVVQRIGLSATQRVLQFAIDDLSSGSRKQCLLINAAYRAELDEDERSVVIDQINAFDESDSDTQRSLGRALDVFQDHCDATHWLFTGGYGRGYDLYDPFLKDRSFIPQELWEIFNQPSQESLASWIKSIAKISISKEFSAISGSVVLHSFPELVGVFEPIIEREHQSDQTQAGLAAALLCSNQPSRLSPLFLRCLLNEDHTGGPIEEQPEMIGELLYYCQKSRSEKVARELMRSLSAQGRAICAGFLRAEINQSDDSQELEQLLFSLGVIGAPQVQRPPLSPEFKLAIGEKVSSSELAEILSNTSESNRDHLSRLVISMVDGDERQQNLRLAQDQGIWSLIDPELAQPHLLSLSRKGWVAREVACVLCGSLGTGVL